VLFIGANCKESSMSDWDWGEIASTAWDLGETAVEVGANLGSREARAVPVIGNALSASDALDHVGAATYDAYTGDRDGAVAEGAQAVTSAVGAIPGFGNMVTGVGDLAVGIPGLGLRAAMTVAGEEDADQVPTSLGDLVAGAAVAGTNAVFGADDSNWVAPGDRPTGNAREQMYAEDAAQAHAIGPFAIPRATRRVIVDEAAHHFDPENTLGLAESREAGSTSGADYEAARNLGLRLHGSPVREEAEH
jgi:hypothetical protein